MSLKNAWRKASDGHLPAIEQAKLWGLRWAPRKLKQDGTQYQWMSEQVLNGAGGHPGRDSVRMFFKRVDLAGKDWHPGMRSKDAGRPAELTEAKADALATAAMRMKKRGRPEPCYENLLAQCPASSINDSTGKPFSRHTVNDLMTSRCYDRTPEHPWEFRFGSKRRPLTDEQRDERWGWAKRLLKIIKGPQWFFFNVIWMDICHKIIPAGPRKAAEALQRGKSKKKRLMSADARSDSKNLGGTEASQKQCSFGDTRVWYVVALARGRLMVQALPRAKYNTETPELAAECVEQLPRMLLRTFGHDCTLPRIIFTDRGQGFYTKRYGMVTEDYDSARSECGFQLWAGANAITGPHAQPADIADVLVHETAIASLSQHWDASSPLVPKLWEETPADVGKRLAACAREVNKEHAEGMADLCKQFPQRLRELKDKKSDRLKY